VILVSWFRVNRRTDDNRIEDDGELPGEREVGRGQEKLGLALSLSLSLSATGFLVAILAGGRDQGGGCCLAEFPTVSSGTRLLCLVC
jgi:hypothetical protein